MMSSNGPAFDFVQGDTLSALTITFTDDDGVTPIDLSGGTAVAVIRFMSHDDLVLSRPMTVNLTIVNASAGSCRYDFAATDLRAGLMRVEGRATTNTGKVVSTKTWTDFEVRRGLS